MEQTISTFLSLLALFVSGLTAWLTLLRRGSLRITRPSFLAFKYDRTGPEGGILVPKIFVRAMLYSTGMQGHVLENMYLVVRHGTESRTFSVWGHGNPSILRGSGLYVPKTGIAENHHFNPPEDESPFRFSAGDYELSLFGEIVGKPMPTELCRVSLSVPEAICVDPVSREFAIWFDRVPNEAKYHAYRPISP